MKTGESTKHYAYMLRCAEKISLIEQLTVKSIRRLEAPHTDLRGEQIDKIYSLRF